MKAFLFRAGHKIIRFFWSWGFLKFVLFTVTLGVLFYAEEDWRWARTWAETKAGWEAKGETFDLNRLVPPPVPAEENLAALPLFKMEPDPDNSGNLGPLALNRAFAVEPNADFPRGGNWEAGKLADAAKNRATVAAAYLAAFKTAPPSGMDSMTQFDAVYPALGELRKAAEARPYCRFEQNYRFDPPYNIYLWLITAQIKLAKVLTAHAVLALDAGKPDVALADLRTSFKLTSGIMEQPLIVSGLVAIGMTAIDFSAVYQGLATHVWNDAQLAELESDLARFDFLTDYQHSFRGETIISMWGFEQYKGNRSGLVSALNPPGETIPPTAKKRRDLSPFVWPDGWMDMLECRAVTDDLTAVGFVDPRARLVYPDRAEHFLAEVEERMRGVGAFTAWGILSGAAAGPMLNAAQKFALMQVWVDEARIACALERYRLAHAAYPASLDALAPGCIDALPHDIMNGQPYHYRLNADGTYLLYSVGWNQTDDGGKAAFQKDNPRVSDSSEGDWVWPVPKS